MVFDRFISRDFGMVVLQPTTLCPWECEYCYLTTKDQRLEMSPEVAAAVARSVRLRDSGTSVNAIWHGGEPLALGCDRFERLLTAFEPLRKEGKIGHRVQTNAGLITPQWCDIFARYEIAVGVSIDGPEWANNLRRDKSGRPAYGRIMRGIETLKSNGLPFAVIAVITKESIERADEIIDFFESLGALSVGFNLEEQEGANSERAVIDRAAATEFWQKLYRRRAVNSSLRIREIDRILNYLRRARSSQNPVPILVEPIPTVAWNGDTVILSPELAGIKAPEYANFIVGNVMSTPLSEMLRTAHEVKYVEEFVGALTSCAANCDFYDFCRGSQACNRYFEHGTFTTSETTFCINTQQSLVQALGEIVGQQERL